MQRFALTGVHMHIAAGNHVNAMLASYLVAFKIIGFGLLLAVKADAKPESFAKILF